MAVGDRAGFYPVSRCRRNGTVRMQQVNGFRVEILRQHNTYLSIDGWIDATACFAGNSASCTFTLPGLRHFEENAYTIRLLFWSYIITVTIETRTITAFEAMVPAQAIVMVPKMGDAALNMVWNNTHINTRPFPDIL